MRCGERWTISPRSPGGATDGGQPLLVELLGPEDGGQGWRSRSARSTVVEADPKQPLAQLPEHGNRHDRGSVLHLLEAGEVARLEGSDPTPAYPSRYAPKSLLWTCRGRCTLPANRTGRRYLRVRRASSP